MTLRHQPVKIDPDDACALCGILYKNHRYGGNADHQFSVVDPGEWRPVLGLLRLTGLDCLQTRDGDGEWVVAITVGDHVGLVRKKGIDQGFRLTVGDLDMIGANLSEVIEKMKGMK